MIAVLVITLSLATHVICQDITTTSCGTSKGCVKLPSSCTSSANCDFLLTYKRRSNDRSIMDFEVSSTRGNGWIALGFNPAQSMAGTKGEICYNGMLRGYHARGYFTPAFETPAANTVLTGISFVNGALICKFSRPVAPSSYQAALGPAMHPIFAVGEISNGFVVKHSHRSFGPQMDLLAFTAATTTAAATTTKPATTTTTTKATTTTAKTTTVTTKAATTTTGTTAIMTTSTKKTTTTTMASTGATTAMETTLTHGSKTVDTTKGSTTMTGYAENMTSTATTLMTKETATTQYGNVNKSSTAPKTYTAMLSAIDVSTCGKTKGCFRIPNGCSTSESCTFLVTWKPDALRKRVEIEVKGNGNKWVAFGFNEAAGQMAGTYGEICYMDGSSTALKGFHAKIRGTPDFTAAMPTGVTAQQISMTNGAITCKYARPFTVTSNLGIDINKHLYIVVAAGDSLNGELPGYHQDKRYFSVSKHNVASAMFGNGGAIRETLSTTVLVFLGIFCMTLINPLW